MINVSSQINTLTRPIFGTWTDVFILGFRPGSVIVDYKMEVGETKENKNIGKEELVQVLKVMVEENKDSTVFEAESVVIEGKGNGFAVTLVLNNPLAISDYIVCFS